MLDKSKSNSDITQAISLMQEIKKNVDDVSMSGGSRIVNMNLKGEMVIEGASMERQADGSIKVNVPPDGENSITYTIFTTGVASATGQWIPLDGFSPLTQALYSGNNTEDVVLPLSNICTFSGLCASGNPVVGIDCDDDSMDVTGAVEGTYLDSEYKVEFIDCDSGNDYVTIVGPEKHVTGFLGVNDAGVIVVKTLPSGDKYKVIFKLVYRELDDLEDSDGRGYLTQMTKKGNTMVGALGSGQLQASMLITGLDRFVEGIADKTGGPLTVTPVALSFGS